VPNHDSIAKFTEAELINRVMESVRMRSHVLGFHDFPARPIWRLQVTLTGLGDAKGDVDILAWNPDHPERALAIEAKVFKGSLAGDDGDAINKLHEFQKAVVQANRLADLGFALVYIMVFVLIDSREQNAEAIEAGRYVYDGLNARLRGEVDGAFCTGKLNRRVGVIRIDYVQSMDDEPLHGVGSTDIHLRDPHGAGVQPEAVTEWVRAQR
jgi:hypothetical protein